MKVVCVFLSFSILLAGCYSFAPLTKEEAAPDDQEVVFYLKDGSSVESPWHGHQRVEGGYQVSGKKVGEGEKEVEFVGIIRDEDIAKIEAQEFDVTRTIFAASLAAAAVFCVILAAASSAGGSWGGGSWSGSLVGGVNHGR